MMLRNVVVTTGRAIFYLVLLIFTAIFSTAVVYYGAKKPEVSSFVYLPVPDSNCVSNITRPNAWCMTGRPCTYPDVVDLRVIVITFNRADSLSKLLQSVNTLVLDGDRAALEIWIDRDRQGHVDQRTLKVASTFSWKVGPTRVHVQVGIIIQLSSFVLQNN